MKDAVESAGIAANAATGLVREYAGSDPMRAVLRMIEAVDDVLRHRLVDASQDEVLDLQARIRMLRTLRRVIAGEAHASLLND